MLTTGSEVKKTMILGERLVVGGRVLVLPPFLLALHSSL